MTRRAELNAAVMRQAHRRVVIVLLSGHVSCVARSSTSTDRPCHMDEYFNSSKIYLFLNKCAVYILRFLILYLQLYLQINLKISHVNRF